MERLLLSRKDLEGLLSLSRSSVARVTQHPDFPRPVRVGRSVRWHAAEVQEWARRIPRDSRPSRYTSKQRQERSVSIVLVPID